VMSAFKLAPEQRMSMQRDALPTTFNTSSLLVKILIWAFILLLVFMLFRCSTGSGAGVCDSTRSTYGSASSEYQSCLNSNRSGSGYRTGGGAFGGFSSGGGGHK
jgi:uncharacterized membrane protein YgcG